MCWTLPSPLWDSLEISSLILFYIDLGLLLFDLEKIEDIHVFEMIIREGLTSLFTLERGLFMSSILLNQLRFGELFWIHNSWRIKLLISNTWGIKWSFSHYVHHFHFFVFSDILCYDFKLNTNNYILLIYPPIYTCTRHMLYTCTNTKPNYTIWRVHIYFECESQNRSSQFSLFTCTSIHK